MSGLIGGLCIHSEAQRVHMLQGGLYLGNSAMKASYGAGEMAQQLRELTSLPEVLSSIPSNHKVAHNHL